MKVGDYVRTKVGIFKCYSEIFIEPSVDIGIGVYPEVEGIWVDEKHINYVETKEIIKSSPNIIDLIEVGDYVNGKKVLDIAQAPKKAIYTEQKNRGVLLPIVNNRIESVLTHEQFESMEYRIGE